MKTYKNRETGLNELMANKYSRSITRIFILFLILSSFLLPGCSGGGGDDENTPEEEADTVEGVFIDATVEGLSYKTGDKSAFTDADGKFTYEKGKPISFYIGSIKLGLTTNGDTVVTPFDLVSNGTINHTEVLNIARFIQTLDVDPSEDHIIIPRSVHTLAAGKSLSFSSASFDADAESIIRLLTESNEDYADIPSLVTITTAKTHLAESLGIELEDDTVDPGDNDEDDEETIVPFTASELAGTWSATVDNGKGFRYVFYYHFSADGTGTIVYTPPYPITDPQEIDWEIATEGKLLYHEYSSGKKESTVVTRYKSGDVVWTTTEGVVAFKASFEKQTDPIDDEEDEDETNAADAFIGKWTVTDSDVGEGQTSQGSWTITESSGTLSASGSWTAMMLETEQYGDVTIKFPFNGAAVTLTSGTIAFTGTGTATATATKFPTMKLQSAFTIAILNATTDSCEYKIAVTEALWNQILPPDSEGYNYSGSGSVVIK